MPNIKFSCPHCQQRIEAESGYAGTQITCPSCQGSFVVPASTVVPKIVPVMARTALTVAAAPSAPPVSAPQHPDTAAGCPSCGAALSRGAILCTNCGYNLKTGRRMQAGRPVPLGRASATQWETPWYKTPWPYVGVVVLVLGLFYFMGRENPAMMLAFLGVAALYSLTVHIIVIIAAFRESTGTGFLTLCIPFYALYFVFKVSANDTLKVLYSVAAIINLSLRFLVKDVD